MRRADSIFTRAYTYRERRGKNELENFTTELFNYCFSYDLVFQKMVLRRLDIHEELERSQTQMSYDEGRPDVEFFTQSYHVIIECKIDSPVDEYQLARYAKILKQSNIRQQTRLVLLTKVYASDVKFPDTLLRWSDIKKLISFDCNPITIQFGDFLSDKQIAMDNYFTISDIATLQNIHPVISKMDAVFDLIELDFKSAFGGSMERTSRSSRMQIDGDGYYNERRFSGLSIFVGFIWYSDNNGLVNIYCGISVGADEKTQKELSLKLSNWGTGDDQWFKYVTRYKNVLDVMGKGGDKDHIDLLADHIKEAIRELAIVKDQLPEMFAS